MKKNRICIFSGFTLPHLGGVERYTEKLVEQLNKLGYKVTIVSSNYDDGKSFEKRKNYDLYRLPVFKICSNRYPILKKNSEYKKIINKINSMEFDFYICQTRFYLTTQLGAKIASKHKKSLIIIEHGSSHFTVNNRLFDFFGEKYEHFLTNKLKKYNPHFYGVSKKCNEWLKHFKIEASGVLYNSIDSAVYDEYKNNLFISKTDKETIDISYIGRIIKEKGVHLLLGVFNELDKKYNMRLFIAGDGPILNELREEYSSNENIHFLGKINYDDVMKLCSQTDIFVHPSMYPEGLPTSILEAGIMKCAVIATDRGGTKEVINDKKYGLIMEENAESLKEKLKYLLDNPEEVKKLQNNIHKRILSEFTWEVTAKKLIEEMRNINENN